MTFVHDAGSGSGRIDPGSTSSALLQRVKAYDPAAWERLVELYGPLVYGWCRRSGLRTEDAADVVQGVFGAVNRGIGGFRGEQPQGSFRAWLRTITRNKVRDLFRHRAASPEARGGTTAEQQLLQIPDVFEPPDGTDTEQTEDALWHRALELVRAQVENRTWEAFWRTVVQDEPPADVAAALGMRLDAVYQAKSRVLRRLRHELSGLEAAD